ncbi:MAG TPA: CRTAC1 family protein [Acidobacteriota bacterium]|nr:CRTAC1 family protein [Acidobacteriota bacterium]
MFSRRHRLLFRYGLGAAIVILAVAILIVGTRSKVEHYLPGRDVKGITRSLNRELPPDIPAVYFEDATAEAGIDFIHFWQSRSTQLPEDMGSGMAWGDYDGDGNVDLFLCNIAGPLTLAAAERERSPSTNRLYRNLGDGTFQDVTGLVGLEFRGFSMGAAWFDYDNDGDLDLFVSNYGTNLLYHNSGGTFQEVTAKVGLDGDKGFWTGIALGDYDRDGDLDIYLCGYVRYEFHSQDTWKTTSQYQALVPFTLNPSSYEPQPNRLYRNDDGVFQDVAKEAGVENGDGRSLAAVWCDFDEDGWPDLYVANDISDNAMYRNLGNGRFEDVSHKAWVADYRGAMGLAVGDWNNDLDLDIFVTHWIAQENALYDNVMRFPEEGTGDTDHVLHFFDIADQVGLGQIALSYIGWATSFLDYDNDGRQDLLVVNGSTFQEEDRPERLIAMRDLLFWNKGPEEGFFEVGEALGQVFTTPRVGRGGAVADFDNDGDLDIVISNHGAAPLLLRNDGGNRGNWIRVRAKGKSHNYFGVGVRVEIETKASRQVQVIGSQASYLSQNSLDAHFGLGSTSLIDRVRLTFPCGHVRELTDVAANQTIVVEELSSAEGLFQ